MIISHLEKWHKVKGASYKKQHIFVDFIKHNQYHNKQRETHLTHQQHLYTISGSDQISMVFNTRTERLFEDINT